MLNLFYDLLAAAIPPFAVLVLHTLRMILFPEASSMDMVAHFFGGFAIAWSAAILWKRWEKRGWFSAHAIIRDYTIALTALFIGVVWEWWEFWMERWTGYVFQPSMGDTMHDLFMDALGGFVLVLLFRFRKYWK